MLQTDRRDDTDLLRLEDVRRVETSAQANFQYLPVNFALAEVEERQRDERLECAHAAVRAVAVLGVHLRLKLPG